EDDKALFRHDLHEFVRSAPADANRDLDWSASLHPLDRKGFAGMLPDLFTCRGGEQGSLSSRLWRKRHMGVPVSQMWTVATYVLRQRLRGRDRYPLVLMLEPLFRCNLACAGCGKIQY